MTGVMGGLGVLIVRGGEVCLIVSHVLVISLDNSHDV